MKRKPEEQLQLQERRKQFRSQHKAHRAQLMTDTKSWKDQGIEPVILDIVEKPGDVDMENFLGSEEELEWTIERFFANVGPTFDPNETFSPSIISNWGQEYSLNCRGIYYLRYFSARNVLVNRKVWVPSVPPTTLKNTPENRERLSRARTFAAQSRNNEGWCKSEYAWEADAWSQAFKLMREDGCLAIDKRKYSDYIPKTDEISCKLTGEYVLKERIPDAVFGMATFTDDDADLPCWTYDLDRSRLEQVLLHPKYGLAVDPKRDDSIGLAFPFMVYEAKGWRGDYREARRQACSAATFYLDMLDQLARVPGPVDAPRAYQTKTSHHYQVFTLTSFGAYWHLLVGYRRPRLEEEHAGVQGMSDTVYIFQKIWSGHVSSDDNAFELLSLIDEIHAWAITEHRSFILDHLRAWHESCNKNFLLEWDSRFDLEDEKKRKRVLNEAGELNLPKWVSYFNEPSRRSIQSRARRSLNEVITHNHQIQKKFDSDKATLECEVDGCSHQMVPLLPIAVHHYRTVHGMDERELAHLRSEIQADIANYCVQERLKKGVTVGGRRSVMLRAALDCGTYPKAKRIEYRA